MSIFLRFCLLENFKQLSTEPWCNNFHIKFITIFCTWTAFWFGILVHGLCLDNKSNSFLSNKHYYSPPNNYPWCMVECLLFPNNVKLFLLAYLFIVKLPEDENSIGCSFSWHEFKSIGSMHTCVLIKICSSCSIVFEVWSSIFSPL